MHSGADEDDGFIIPELYQLFVTQSKHRVHLDILQAFLPLVGRHDHQIKPAAFVAPAQLVRSEEYLRVVAELIV